MARTFSTATATAALALALAGVPATAAAAVSRGDQAATKAFIGAEARYLTHALGKAGNVAKTATALVDHVAATCPNSLANLPSPLTTNQQDVILALEGEAGFDFAAAALAPLAADLRAQSKTFSKQHWSRTSINRAVAAYVRGEGMILSTPPTDLCSDIAAASATNFTQPGQGTIALLNKLSALPNFKDPSKLQTMMRPFLTASARAEAKKVHRTATKLTHAIDPTLTAQSKRLVTALFGSTPPPGGMRDLPH